MLTLSKCLWTGLQLGNTPKTNAGVPVFWSVDQLSIGEVWRRYAPAAP
jgi:hypothetical protein